MSDQKSFGIAADKATVLSVRALNRIFDSSFWFPTRSQHNPKYQPVRHPVFGLSLNSRSPDVQALLDDNLPDEALRMLAATVREASGNPETPIFRSLEHPRLLQALLKAGHNPDHTNLFGKTALMYAAQFDLLPAVNVLLAHGAGVHLRTEERHTCEYYGTDNYDVFNARSALDYALNDAGESVIGRLIVAVPVAERGGPATWHARLEGNSKLDAVARERLLILLAAP